MRSYLELLLHDKAGASGDGRKFMACHIPSLCSMMTRYDEHQVRYDYAVNHEDKNAAGHIQIKMAEYADEVWDLMQDKTHVHMCGLKGMESGMAECFGPTAEKNVLVWAEFAKAMKIADRYHVEVY